MRPQDQLDLFTYAGRITRTPRARARHTDPEPAHAAAAAITPKLPAMWHVIRDHYREAGARGLTSLQLAAVSGIERVSCSPCLRPMERAGLLIDTGEKRVSCGSRSPGIVWRIA